MEDEINVWRLDFASVFELVVRKFLSSFSLSSTLFSQTPLLTATKLVG